MVAELLQLYAQLVIVTKRAIVEMMHILNPYIEPNVVVHNCKQHNVDWVLVPKLPQFLAKSVMVFFSSKF